MDIVKAKQLEHECNMIANAMTCCNSEYKTSAKKASSIMMYVRGFSQNENATQEDIMIIIEQIKSVVNS